jgi:hypothetical protein
MPPKRKRRFDVNRGVDLVDVRLEGSANTKVKGRARPSAGLDGVPWFDLRHYDSIAAWEPKHWYAAIACRLAVIRYLQYPDEPLAQARIREHFDNIRLNPIAPGGYVLWNKCVFANGASLEFLPPISVLACGIADVSKLSESEEIMFINTSASDAVLKSTFAAWLKDLRSPSIWSKGFTRTDMRSWTDCRVLPFVDLHLFEKFAGLKIAAGSKAGVLSDGRHEKSGSDPVEYVRKVTAKHAARLMSERTLASMAAQLGGEAFAYLHANSKARRTGRPKARREALTVPPTESELWDLLTAESPDDDFWTS